MQRERVAHAKRLADRQIVVLPRELHVAAAIVRVLILRSIASGHRFHLTVLVARAAAILLDRTPRVGARA
jgi:hypothetical protein